MMITFIKMTVKHNNSLNLITGCLYMFLWTTCFGNSYNHHQDRKSSLNAIVALSKNCQFTVNTTIQLKSITATPDNNGI